MTLMASPAPTLAPPQATTPSDSPQDSYRGKRTIPADAKPFDEHFKARRKDLIKQGEDAKRLRTQVCVTMIKRYRGDSLGFFYNNKWEEMPSKGLHKYNIFWPVVRSNNTNWVSTNVQLDIKSARSDPEKQAGTTVAQVIYDYYNDRVWTENFEELMSDMAQLQKGYHIETYFSKNEGNGLIKVPQTSDTTISLSGGEYTCAGCGSTGPNEVLDKGNAICPECGKTVAPGQEPEGQWQGQKLDGYESTPEGEIQTRLRSSFEIRIDETNAKAGDPSGAYWLNHHCLRYRFELYQLMPWLKEKMEKDAKMLSSEWSDSLQWKRGLEIGSGTQRSGFGDTTGNKQTGKPDDLLEYCRWWFMPVAVEDYVSPDHYKHECGWDIYPGENVRDAFERQKKDYTGLYLTFVCEEIGFIASDDKNKRWTGGGFGVDASGYWCKAQEDLLDFQEIINKLLTLQVDHAMYNSLPKLILDRKMFDRQNFRNVPGSVSYTRAGFNTQGQPLTNFFAQVLPGGMDPAVFNLFGMVLDGAQNTSGVQPSTVGAPDPTDKTYQGQLLKRQASVGLMIPSQKMKKRAKIAWAYHVLFNVQKYRTKEWIMRIMNTADHSWDDADIDAFKALDIENDLVITGVEGSDIPVTHQEKEMKLAGLISSGIVNNPAVPKELQSLAFQYAGVKYDSADYEAQMRSADSRLREIRELVQLCKASRIAYIAAPPTTMDETTGMEVPNPAAGQIVPNMQAAALILQQPNAKILPRQDDHESHIQFYNRHIIALAASPNVDEFELMVLQTRVDEHLAQIALNARDAMGMETFAQQPAVDAANAGKPSQPDKGAEMEAKGKAAEESDQRKSDMSREADQRKSDESEAQRQHERVESAKQRSHEAELAKRKSAAPA